jgi:peptide/nickel transport system ATP-binding protein
VLILLRKLQQEFGMALMFVTHDLGVAAQIADRVAVMYAGRIVEEGSAQEVLLHPRHPYTIGMLASTMEGRVRGRDIEAIPGSPPDMRALPKGCSFAPRCRFAAASCRETTPDAVTVAPGHNVACLRVAEVLSSPKVAVS